MASLDPNSPVRKKFKIPSSDIDFSELSKQYGYIKARQIVLQRTIEKHQAVIAAKDESQKTTFKKERVQESIRLSSTLGQPSAERPLDKIRNASKKAPSEEEIVKNPQVEVQYNATLAFSRAIISEDNKYAAAQYGLHSLPTSFGDTLYLQTLGVKTLSLPRNEMTSFFNHEQPQLASIHFRNVITLNLSGNKLKRLPADLGNMKSLQVLNLCENLLSKIPNTISELTSLTDLNLSNNSFSDLSSAFGTVISITKLDLSRNLFLQLPACLSKLFFLKHLNISNNMIAHMAILPSLLKPSDLWIKTVDLRTGRDMFINFITREKVKSIESYDGSGMERAVDLHTFQSPTQNLRSYRRRRNWLSICQIHEWEAVEDTTTGWCYFRNNVSGETQWDMPPSLDTFGKLENLEVIELQNNYLRALCPSIYGLKKLKRLILFKNRLHEISDQVSQLVSLEFLDTRSNEIKLLPVSICQCDHLQEIIIQDNHLVRLPDKIGLMKSLRKIDAAANRLSQIPFSIGYSTVIQELHVQENPLVDPPFEEVLKGMDSLKWYLRSRLLLDKHGFPPEMEYHEISIMHEVTILKPELYERIKHLSHIAEKSGFLNLQLLGIRELPRHILKIKKLKKLQLDFNPRLIWKGGIPPEFSMLKSLSLKSCYLPSLPDSVSNLKRLSSFYCELNKFELLPNTINRLKFLVTLDLSKNRLHYLPPKFDDLSSLKHLYLQGNNLEDVPSCLGNIKSLATINLSSNRIIDFPHAICGLSNLKKLNVENNRLYSVPLRIRHLNVVDLRLGHNRIEYFSEDIFDFELGQSVKVFSFCENNVMELPSSVQNIDVNCLFEADYNPLISPPPFLISEGLTVLQEYLRIRHLRMLELRELLEEEDFEVVYEHFTPVAFEVLSDGTGFLTPDDLEEFDQAVDEYINGEYYQCPALGEEIVQSLVKLRENRETELYLTVLTTFLQVLDDIFAYRRKEFSDAVFQVLQRPWGRKGELCNCYCLSLQALLAEAPISQFHKEIRPSVFNLVKQALPAIPFPFTIDLLKDSLRLYVSPYGQVADTEKLVFPSCDCVDPQRGKPLRHVPCEKACILITKIIYNEEEASRRDVEEDEYLERFKEIEFDINVWLVTEEGKLEVGKELMKRDVKIAEEISLREEILLMEQVKLKQCREDLLQRKIKKDQFDKGLPYETHGYLALSEAVEAITQAEEAIGKSSNRLDAVRTQLARLKAELQMEFEVKRQRATDDLVQKYCCLSYRSTIKSGRVYAAQRDLRRPWDGEDGVDYISWRKKFAIKLGELTSLEEITSEQETAILGDNEDAPEYSWENTEDMKKYTFALYLRYMGMRNSIDKEALEEAGKPQSSWGIKLFGK